MNPNFHGTIAFCGDLTSYKFDNNNKLFVERYGNEMTIELFEELLSQTKEHNNKKIKKKTNKYNLLPFPAIMSFMAFKVHVTIILY